MNMKRIIWIPLLCLPLLGNSCKQDDRVVAFEAGKRQVEVDKRILADCPDLMKLQGRSEEEVVKFIEQLTTQYQECRAWKGQLDKIVKDAFNVEAP